MLYGFMELVSKGRLTWEAAEGCSSSKNAARQLGYNVPHAQLKTLRRSFASMSAYVSHSISARQGISLHLPASCHIGFRILGFRVSHHLASSDKGRGDHRVEVGATSFLSRVDEQRQDDCVCHDDLHGLQRCVACAVLHGHGHCAYGQEVEERLRQPWIRVSVVYL